MEEKFNLRDPYIDLTDTWKLQPRDAHGRWSKTGAALKGIESVALKQSPSQQALAKQIEDAKALRAIQRDTASGPLRDVLSPHVHAVKVRSTTTTHVKVSKGRAHLELFKMDSVETEQFFHDNGLTTRFSKLTDAELSAHLAEPTNSYWNEAVKEAKLREQRIHLLVRSVEEHEELLKAQDGARKFDHMLLKIPGGKAFIRAKDRLLQDHAVQKFLHGKEKAKDFTKETIVHTVVRAMVGAMVLGAAGAIAHATGGDVESVKTAVENVAGALGSAPEGALTVATSTGLGSLLALLNKLRKHEAIRERYKIRDKRH